MAVIVGLVVIRFEKDIEQFLSNMGKCEMEGMMVGLGDDLCQARLFNGHGGDDPVSSESGIGHGIGFSSGIG